MRSTAVAVASLVALAGCASTPDRGIDRRVAEALQGVEADPAVRAREAEVEAALARESGVADVDSVQLRARPTYQNGDAALRLTARVGIPNPLTRDDRLAVRQAETETAVTRLSETSLERRAELCFGSIEAEAHREMSRIYADFAERQKVLLDLNDSWRRGGSMNESSAVQFEIEGRIKLATRKPGPAPPQVEWEPQLPELRSGPGALVTSEGVISEKVRRHSPSVAIHESVSKQYAALSARARSQGKPWFDFIDVIYHPVPWEGGENAVGVQLAVRVPFGVESRSNVARYEAMRRSEMREADARVRDQMRRSLFALRELRQFEADAGQWRDLLVLATDAQVVADRWRVQRLVRPSQVENLVDRAYDAKVAVLEARERAGVARCTVLAMTGVSLDDWPRE